MFAKKNRITLTVLALLAFGALITGIFVSQHLSTLKKIDPNLLHGTLLDKPREVNQFSLTGTDSLPFTNASLQGQWTLVFFGFTQCGYLCPTTMAELAKMYRLLEDNSVKPLPHIVMVSIDPQRDSLDKLNQYVTAFNPHFYGARGNEEAVNRMTRELGIAYARVALPTVEDPKNYDVQHSGALMLFNPKGELSAFFTTPHQADFLAKDYQLLVA